MLAEAHSLRLEPQRPIVEFTEPAIVAIELSVKFESILARTRNWTDPVANALLRHTLPPTRLGDRSVSWALQCVTFTIYPSEIVALVGERGAGKSTLLKLLVRSLGPTSGTLQLRGRVSPILHETEPGDAINSADYYHEIVLIDGPGSGRPLSSAWAPLITEVQQQSRTVIIATHDLQFAIDHCTRALWLRGGVLAADGSPHEITRQILESTKSDPCVSAKIAARTPI